MRPGRKPEGFNIAFLDIMACGLGAIILVFMIVKQNVAHVPVEADLLQADLAKLQDQETALRKSISELGGDAETQGAKIAEIQAQISSLLAEMRKKSDATTAKKMELSSIKDTIKNAPKAKVDDVVQNDKGGEEDYIMGIKVEGRKIAFLIDASASMTDEKLIDIIRRKNATDSEKKRGPKWKRTKRIARWLLSRLPKSGEVSVLAYNNTVTVLGGADWHSNRDSSRIQALYGDIDRLVPSGATNLQLALQKVSALRPTDIYVVTDGLPTTGQSSYRSLNPFAACGSLLGTSPNISGECRVKLFRQSIYESTPQRGAKINVILLPIEGDPEASPEYWAWTASTGGLLISPAVSWP